MDYRSIKLSQADIESRSYENFFGGGQKHWKTRGAFQLHFLQAMGLEKYHRLLDIGCGPLRAGVHFIGYLDSGRYLGVDYNHDLIRAAKTIVDHHAELRNKLPRLEQVDDFNFGQIDGNFAYMLAFSVLNHCSTSERQNFFKQSGAIVGIQTKIYVTHAEWFNASYLEETRLRVTKTFNRAKDIASDLDLKTWGWPQSESIFPILEISVV